MNASKRTSNSAIDKTLDIISLYYKDKFKDEEETTIENEEHVLDIDEIPPRYFENTKMYMIYIITGILLGTCMLSTVNFIKTLYEEKTYYFIALYPLVPIGIIYFSFAVASVIGSLFFWVAASNRSLDSNSQYYSAIKTPIPKNSTLPMIIVQMPVYKESLEEVILKSFDNVKKAMDVYIQHGGTCKFFICDDGLQLISDKDVRERIAFYKKNNITFIARPPQNRKGLFKKASNMNYSLDVSIKTMEYMKNNQVSCEEGLFQVWKDKNEEFIGWGDVTIPDDCLILLIDADTKVPVSCMYDVVGEFLEDESVAYTQHYTQPFDEQCANYWEQLISFFTKKIYMVGIAASVCMGDTAPLVGHNAFLRWSSVKKVAFYDEDDKRTKYWSESHVSEDFDLYIRLASINEFGRYVMYTGDEFQEGVSLSYSDEVIKFRKFAYGACELVFNRFNEWFTKGPINKNYIDYLQSKHIKWYDKISMSMYMSSFFAMASAFPLMMFEGVAAIVKPDLHEKYMVRNFDVMLTCTFIFGIISNFGNIALNWRRESLKGRNNIITIIWDELKWVPFIALFFNSMLFHMTQAAFTYFFNLKVVWGATVKETVNKDCITALKETFQAYKVEYILFSLMIVIYSWCLVHFDVGMYRGWGVMMYCACHLVGPIILNPHIMSFSY
jgi:hypothetical protein